MKSSFCLFADIYGFSALMQDTNLGELSKKLKKLHEGIQKTILDRRLPEGRSEAHLLQFSDCIFLIQTVDDTDCFRSLETFINIVSEIYEYSFTLKLPLRGCITYGDVINLEHAVLGTPVIQAVSIEKDLGLPLIVLPSFTLTQLPDFDQGGYESLENLTTDILYQGGVMAAVPILPRNLEKIRDYASAEHALLSKQFNKAKPAGAWRRLCGVITQRQKRLEKKQ